MGKIKERLRMARENQIKGGIWTFEYAGEAIESELQKLAETVGKKLREQDKEIEKLKQDILDFFEMLAQRTKRIERIEEEFMDHLANEHNIEIRKPKKDPLSYDRHNKPEGGLEPWDVMSYTIHYPERPKLHGRKCFGQFHHKDGDGIWGHWQNWQTRELSKGLEFVYQDRVTFLFRPKYKES